MRPRRCLRGPSSNRFPPVEAASRIEFFTHFIRSSPFLLSRVGRETDGWEEGGAVERPSPYSVRSGHCSRGFIPFFPRTETPFGDRSATRAHLSPAETKTNKPSPRTLNKSSSPHDLGQIFDSSERLPSSLEFRTIDGRRPPRPINQVRRDWTD